MLRCEVLLELVLGPVNREATVFELIVCLGAFTGGRVNHVGDPFEVVLVELRPESSSQVVVAELGVTSEGLELGEELCEPTVALGTCLQLAESFGVLVDGLKSVAELRLKRATKGGQMGRSTRGRGGASHTATASLLSCPY